MSFLLIIKISRFTRNDKKENYDTVSKPIGERQVNSIFVIMTE